MVMKFFKWLFKPSFVIGSPDSPYLLRWFLIPRNPWFNVYLHKFLRDDEDRAIHDHPWWFISFLIWGRYDEIVSDDGRKVIYRDAPSIAFRKATHKHRVVLPTIIDVDPKTNEFTYISHPAWTIVITGPNVRTWGFWCPKGFVPWYEFVDSTDSGNIGKGCGDE